MIGMLNDNYRTDVLIIGSGLAGLLLALELSQLGIKTVLTCKGSLPMSNTSSAQGGIAAVTGHMSIDSWQTHLEDTLACGCGLTDLSVARQIVSSGSALIDRLCDLGVAFDGMKSGQFGLALEGGHSQARVVHVRDTTGSAISQALIKKIVDDPKIMAIEHAYAGDLISREGRCYGTDFLIARHKVSVYADHTVLATGGAGQIFARTTNPKIATGDGVAMAWRAGATLADLEFVQFHPTALCKEGAPPFLISEAVRGSGAILLDGHGKPFAKAFHPAGELATRDIVARAINTVMTEQGLPFVWLDLSPIGAQVLAKRFPNIVETCRMFGIDPVSQLVPVAPAAHYMMGGISTNYQGVTDVEGLYAIGECAATGLHGANRLASNSLLEAGAMALSLAAFLSQQSSIGWSQPRLGVEKKWRQLLPIDIEMFRGMMYKLAGVERNQKGLSQLLSYCQGKSVVAELEAADQFEQANQFLLGQLIAYLALLREESRGSHWRTDFPSVDDGNFLRRQYINQNDWQETMVSSKMGNAAIALTGA